MKLINHDLIQRILYSTDISLYEIIPSGVATPKTVKDVRAIVDFCSNHALSITSRGSGTSTVGQAIGSGIIIDHSKFMNKILNIGTDYVDVEPGMILSALNEELKPHGLFFPVDPSSAEVCTIGGMVGNNSSGIHSFLYGDTKDYVAGVEGFWADGQFFSTIECVNIETTLKKLSSFVKKTENVKQHLPLTSKNSSGYNILEAFSSDTGISLDHLITGSEGTLCVLTKIRLKLIPIPQKRTTLLALFDDFEKALEAVTVAKNLKGLSAIELLDHEMIKTTREHFPEFRTFFNENIKAGLLFEVDGANDFVSEQNNELGKLLHGLALKTEIATSDEKRKKLWWFRRSASKIFNRTHGSTRSLRFIEDVAVPFDKIIEFYRAEKKILDDYGLKTAFFGHIGSGHFHINPRIDTRDPKSQKKVDLVAQRTYELVKALGGTFSAEHGDGVLREPYLRKMQPELYSLFYEIKNELDPKWTLNPGKIVRKDKIKYASRYEFKPIKNVPDAVVNAVEKCHGCNDCIHFCKSKDFNARARANVMRNIVSGTLSTQKELKKAVGHIEKCRLCGNCLLECPTGVDLLETASLLREYGIISMSPAKKALMIIFSPLKMILKHKIVAAQTGTKLELSSIFNIVLRLGLYYKPYTRELLHLVKEKKIALVISDLKLQKYITFGT